MVVPPRCGVRVGYRQYYAPTCRKTSGSFFVCTQRFEEGTETCENEKVTAESDTYRRIGEEVAELLDVVTTKSTNLLVAKKASSWLAAGPMSGVSLTRPLISSARTTQPDIWFSSKRSMPINRRSPRSPPIPSLTFVNTSRPLMKAMLERLQCDWHSFSAKDSSNNPL